MAEILDACCGGRMWWWAGLECVCGALPLRDGKATNNEPSRNAAWGDESVSQDGTKLSPSHDAAKGQLCEHRYEAGTCPYEKCPGYWLDVENDPTVSGLLDDLYAEAWLEETK